MKSHIILASLWVICGPLYSMLAQAQVMPGSPPQEVSESRSRPASKKNQADEISGKKPVDRSTSQHAPEHKVTAITETPHNQNRQSFLIFLQILRSSK